MNTLDLKQTGLEEFSFGDAPDDVFYILVNKTISPEGIDINKLTQADPRNFDAALTEAGCILMLNQPEVEELQRRGEIDMDNLHKSLFGLAKREGLIR